jgi:hypothetical protein
MEIGKLPYNQHARLIEQRMKYQKLFSEFDEAAHVEVDKTLVCEDCYFTSTEYKNLTLSQ